MVTRPSRSDSSRRNENTVRGWLKREIGPPSRNRERLGTKKCKAHLTKFLCQPKPVRFKRSFGSYFRTLNREGTQFSLSPHGPCREEGRRPAWLWQVSAKLSVINHSRLRANTDGPQKRPHLTVSGRGGPDQRLRVELAPGKPERSMNRHRAVGADYAQPITIEFNSFSS